jgi:DNA-binding transcriptional LysR family regulator
MDDLNALAIFVSVAEYGSYTKAAKAASLPKSTVSRQVARLEKELNAPLLHRSTRAISLTDEGQRLFERARLALIDLRASVTEFHERQTRVTGTVRISATAAFGQRVVAPVLCGLMRREPELRIDLQLSDARSDIIQSGIDLAVRMGALPDSDLRARRLCTVARVLCASPEYLRGKGMPSEPNDLTRHSCIVTAPGLTRWTFASGRDVVVNWRLSVGSVLLAHDVALAGQGVALLPNFIAEKDLAKGRLIQVLPEFPLPDAVVAAVYPNDRVPAKATGAVLAYLVQELSNRRL